MEWIWKYLHGKKFIKHRLLDDLIINILKFKIQYSRVRLVGRTRDAGEGGHPRRHSHWSQRQEHQSRPQDHNPEPQSHWLPDPYHRSLQSEIFLEIIFYFVLRLHHINPPFICFLLSPHPIFGKIKTKRFVFYFFLCRIVHCSVQVQAPWSETEPDVNKCPRPPRVNSEKQNVPQSTINCCGNWIFILVCRKTVFWQNKDLLKTKIGLEHCYRTHLCYIWAWAVVKSVFSNCYVSFSAENPGGP